MDEMQTIARITERYMCSGIVRDVKEMVCIALSPYQMAVYVDHVFSPFKIRTCDICQRVNRKMVISTPELYPVPVKASWFHIGIDFVGPLPTSLKGNRYLLTISDYFSKLAETVQ